ncbi:hypothetical protein FA13DRAFT_1802192 [Coprinellus micaceus]|uniref:Uncharacterized protein n=1 Tax=Coprinellus micaceus TaxID=71717 RepID=A0A4Y7SDF3_COPMI|nr:hypothetical protein FA13DRAFT_1802192 [Coprinellus micaceus]
MNPHPPASHSRISRASTLCLWYLRSLRFGTHKDRLLGSSTRLLLPADVADDTLYRAFMYLKRYQKSVEDQREQLRTRFEDRMDELPLVLSFYLALELAILEVGTPRSELEIIKAGVKPSPIPDFGKYGFVEAERCSEHRPDSETSTSARDDGTRIVKKAYPHSKDLHCGPDVCCHGMWVLFLYFKNRVLQADSASSLSEADEFAEFKIKLLKQEYIAKVCAAYLKSLKFGTISSTLERVAVMHSTKAWPWTTYAGGLFLLHRYKASPHFADGHAPRDVELELAFYASFAIANALVRSDDEEFLGARYIFARLGFPHALEERTRRRICKKHVEAAMARARTKREERRDKRRRGEDGEGRVGTLLTISPGPVTSGISAREYMGCDEGVVCTDGMVRLKDYMLAMVFKWDLNVHFEPDRSEFLEFEREVKHKFGYGVMLGQSIG